MSDVNRVMDDLEAEIARPLSLAQRATFSAWAERVLAEVGRSGEVIESVKSSAYEDEVR